MNHAQVRDGIRDAVESIDDVRVERSIPASVNGTTAVIALADGVTDSDFDDGFTVNWAILFLIPRTDDVRAQDAVDDFLSTDTATSVFAALRDDPTLGGVVDSSRVTGWQQPAITEFAGNQFVVAEINLEVLGD